MSTILGLRGTGGWSNERPTNFREGILRLYPSSPAVLTMLSGKLKSDPVDDPKFTIFEKGISPSHVHVNGALADESATTLTLDSTAGLQTGSVLYNNTTGEYMRVSAVSSGTACTVARDIMGETSDVGVADNEYLTIVGTAFAEGASVPGGTSTTASEVYNYTQIFRTPVELTGTMKETYLRTGDVEKELKRESAERHAIEMEWSALLGNRFQSSNNGYGSSQYTRYTGGLLDFISTNVLDVATDSSGVLGISDFEGWLEDLFLVPNGKDEKLMVCGNQVLTVLNQMARSYGDIQLVPGGEVFGLKIMRWETPYGTLYLKGHALLSQNPTFKSWGFAVDLANFRYRPLRNRDTQYLTDRQSPGDDKLVHEFLTEAGWEIRHESTHGIMKGVSSFAP